MGKNNLTFGHTDIEKKNTSIKVLDLGDVDINNILVFFKTMFPNKQNEHFPWTYAIFD